MVTRVGLLGGSFDPVHYGHLRAAQWAFETLALGRVLLVPARQSPFKGPCAASAEDRLAMLNLAAHDNPSLAVEDCELRRVAPSYTVDTLRTLARRSPAVRFTLILGSDAAAGLEKWRDIEEVRRLAEIAILGRPGGSRTDLPVTLLAFEGLSISSTRIRATVKEGRSIRYLTPDSVRLYIEEKGLYS
jgi:nicotinate-nucleotide adenylyltransferase